MSMDVDLFTDAEYNSIDFDFLDQLFLETFNYVEKGFGGNNSMGKSYFIGNIENDTIKVELFYTDPFVFPHIEYENLRLS
jgi:hypothetical protein